MRVFLAILALWSCSFWGVLALPEPDMEAAKTKAEAEFTAWLASPEVQKTIKEKNLGGNYVFTVVLKRDGRVETVYADENPEENNIQRQNEMVRLIRTFRSDVQLPKNQRLKFKPAFIV